MALSPVPAGPGAAAPAARPVRLWTFVRIKLRVLANGFRGQGWRIALFCIGAFVGLWFAASAFALFALSGSGDGVDTYARLAPALGGPVLVLGWTLMPLVFFGVDETLEPGRFALLPVPRRTLLRGLTVAALIGVPPVATLIGTSGLVVAAARIGGAAAAVGQVVGVIGGLLTCVLASRAVTSAFARLLASRRMRDLAAIGLAIIAALFGPLQLVISQSLTRSDPDRLLGVGTILGWTPLGAPYTVGVEIADGRLGAALAKLTITAATIAALAWWWSRTIESAMVAATVGGSSRTARGDRGVPVGPVGQLFAGPLGWLPRTRSGALMARETRYWWRDARRRANLITVAIVAIFLPVAWTLTDIGGGVSPGMFVSSMVFVGAVAALTLANQFGFDGSAYAMHVVAGVPGGIELRGRLVGFSTYVVPVLALGAVGTSWYAGLLDRLPVILGGLFAAYGTGLGVTAVFSVIGAYALPEGSNPFAINTGAGVVKSLLALVAMLASIAASAPIIVFAFLAGESLPWLVLVVGLAYGVGGATLGTYIGGSLIDNRGARLLAAVTPRR